MAPGKLTADQMVAASLPCSPALVPGDALAWDPLPCAPGTSNIAPGSLHLGPEAPTEAGSPCLVSSTGLQCPPSVGTEGTLSLCVLTDLSWLQK